MLTITDVFRTERCYDVEKELAARYDREKIAYFDIETTGFSSKNHQIYLIGAAYRNEDNTFTVIQWFDDTSGDEAKMLLMFRDFLKNFDILINFNGNMFDVPFVASRAEKYGIHFNFERLLLVDLYKEARRYKNFFRTPDLKQKSLEVFLGIAREDKYNGGQLIDIYKEYIRLQKENHSHRQGNEDTTEDLKRLLLLHNHDDMTGLVNVCDIWAYLSVWEGKFEVTDIRLTEDSGKALQLLLQCHLDGRLKRPIFDKSEDFCYDARDNTLKFLVPVIHDELKHYFENYRDYYYLPNEDTAIHKSVAQFVDKNYREKSTKDNCYIKKQGTFAFQPAEIFTPSFKSNVSDKKLFFEVDREKTALSGDSAGQLKTYVLKALEYMYRKH